MGERVRLDCSWMCPFLSLSVPGRRQDSPFEMMTRESQREGRSQEPANSQAWTGSEAWWGKMRLDLRMMSLETCSRLRALPRHLVDLIKNVAVLSPASLISRTLWALSLGPRRGGKSRTSTQSPVLWSGGKGGATLQVSPGRNSPIHPGGSHEVANAYSFT